MPAQKQNRQLDIDEDMNFQRKEWRIERIGWVGMALIVAAALLGLFGQGPLSATTADNGPLHVQYGRFERLLAPVQIKITFDQAVVQNDEVRISVDVSILEHYMIRRIIPEPDSEEITSGQVTYVYKIAKAGDRFEVIYHMEGNTIGPVNGRIAAENGPSIEVHQFIFP